MPLLNRCPEILLSFAVLISPLAASSAQTPQDPAQKAQEAAKAAAPTSMTATIEAIDVANRLVTLKGPDGNLAEVYVDESHKRFNDLKVGDQVKASYYESLAVNVRKPGDPAPTSGIKEAITPRVGGPGGTISQQATITVTIMALDPAVPSVTVKGPKGNVMSMRIKDPKRLEGIKVGDTVDVTYTRALLISVDSIGK
jgi:Cu/Ag efflux protein CusF